MTLAVTLTVGSAGDVVGPEEAGTEFHFVVLGDSQFDDPPGFNRLIDEVRLLLPAFVIQVGDMIEGYSGNLEQLDDEWRRFKNQVAPLAPIAYLPVPGNHDLYNDNLRSDPRIADLFRNLWGATHYTFHYGNSTFIVLNTDSPENENRIDPAQWQWLEQALNTSSAEHIFLFMHRPPRLLVNADALHKLLIRHPVKFVFYGHHHHYHFEERDGIAYVMTNAAADSGLDHQELGSFDHFLQVSVRDEQINLGVVRAGAVMPPDSAHPSDNYDLFSINRSLAPAVVELTALAERRWEMQIPLRNPSARTLQLYIECGSADNRWQFSPEAIEPIELAPDSQQALTLEVGYSENRQPESDPVCQIKLPFLTAPGIWIDHLVTVVGKPGPQADR
jgi:hypothetical protein